MANPEISRERQNELYEIEGNVLGELAVDAFDVGVQFGRLLKDRNPDNPKYQKYDMNPGTVILKAPAEYKGVNREFLIKLTKVDDAMVVKVEGTSFDGSEGSFSVDHYEDGSCVSGTRDIGRYTLSDMTDILASAHNRYTQMLEELQASI